MDENKLQKKIEDMFEKGILLSQDSLDQELDEILLEKIKADRKSTRLNSSHGYISYAAFRLQKKQNMRPTLQ